MPDQSETNANSVSVNVNASGPGSLAIGAGRDVRNVTVNSNYQSQETEWLKAEIARWQEAVAQLADNIQAEARLAVEEISQELTEQHANANEVKLTSRFRVLRDLSRDVYNMILNGLINGPVGVLQTLGQAISRKLDAEA